MTTTLILFGAIGAGCLLITAVAVRASNRRGEAAVAEWNARAEQHRRARQGVRS